MKEKDDGGFAFPAKSQGTPSGLTKREYYAAHAPVPQNLFAQGGSAGKVIDWAWAYADEMIERGKPPEIIKGWELPQGSYAHCESCEGFKGEISVIECLKCGSFFCKHIGHTGCLRFKK